MTAEEKAKKEEPKEEKHEKKEQPKAEKKEAKEEAKAKEQPKKEAAAKEEEAPAEPKEELKHPRCKVTRMTLEQVEKQLATTQEKMGGLSSHFAKSLLDRRAALLDEQQTAGTQRKAA